MTLRKYHRTFTIGISLIILFIIVQIILSTLGRNRFELHQKLLHRAEVLSNELHQSSELLTRMARSYVMTGDTSFLNKYYEVLDIRNGKKQRSDGQLIPFRTLLQELKLTKEEAALLRLSEDNSNALAKIEIEAFEAIQGKRIDASGNVMPPDPIRAQELLFSKEYYLAKSDIMAPIERFDEKVQERISTIIKREENLRFVYFSLFGIALAAMFIWTYMFILGIRKRVLIPLKRGELTAKQVQAGDFHDRWNYQSEDEIGDLTRSFNSMLDHINESNEELHTAIENATDLNLKLNSQSEALNASAIVVTTNLKGDITYCNDKFTEISGYSREEAMGQNHRIVNSGYHPVTFWKEMYATVGKGGIWRADVRNVAKDGHIYWVDSVIAPIKNEKGEVKEYLGIRFDITEKKEIEERLHAQNLALDETAIVSVTDVKGNILRANKLFEKVSKFSMEEIIGANHRIVSSGYHSKEFWKGMYHNLANGKSWRADVKNKAKDGTYYWVDSTMVPIYYDQQKPQEYLAVRFLITDKKESEIQLAESEKQFNSIVQNVPGAIYRCTVDDDKQLLFISDRFSEITGYPISKFQGKHKKEFVDLILEEDLHEGQKTVEGAVKDGRSFLIDYRLRRQDGSIVWIRERGKGIANDQGDVVFQDGTFFDVTATKEAEEKLQKSQQQLQSIFDTLPVGMVMINAEGKTLAANGITESILGISADEQKQRTLQSQKWEIIREDGTSMPVEEYPASRALSGEKIVKDVIMGVHRPDESLVWINVSSAMLSNDSNDGVVVAFEDVTEAKKTKEIILRNEKKASLLRDLALESANVRDIDSLLSMALEAVLAYTEWDVAHVYMNREEVLVPARIWAFSDKKGYKAFQRITEKTKFKPGEGLPGRVFKDKEIHWIANVHDDKNYPRAQKGEVEIKGAFAVPIIVNDKVYDVLEFYSKDEQEESEDIVDFVAQIGVQISNAIERNEMLDEISDSQEQYSTLVSNVPGIIFRCLIDEHWTMLFISEQVELISGYPAESFMNNRDMSYADLIYREDLQKVQDAVAEKIKIKERYAVEYRIRRADGEERWVKSQGQAVFDENDEIKWLDGAIIDITDQKSAEQEIQHISMLSDNALELTKSGFWYYDLADEEHIILSEKVINMLGADVKEGNKYPMAIWNENMVKADEKMAALVEEEVGRALSGEAEMYNIQYPIFRPKTRDIIWVHDVGHIQKDEKGNATRIFGVLQNITEQKLAEQALAEAKAQAEAATEAKSSFLANMSHEIRTPMNAIIGFSHLIQKTDLDEKQEDYIHKIESSSKSLLGIINDILDFSKIEAGKLTIENAEFDLESVFQDLANIITYKAHEKGLEIVFGIDSKVPTYLIGDPLRLGQILTNLSNNAIKFTEHGEIVVTAQLISEKEDHVEVQFSVKDSGIGIEKDKIPSLFESFTQADTSTSRKFGGTGLGLAISKNLAQMMNGRIWAESEFGHGSTFSFTARLKKQDQASKDLVPSTDLRGLKVLVVDDSEAARETLRQALESFSFDVTTAESAKDGIKLLKEQGKPFELVLMDWNMPDIDGLEASERILKDPQIPKTPMIMMVTAYGKEDVIQQSEKLGLASLLIKPVRYSLLFDTIMNSFGKTTRRVKRKDQKLTEQSKELDKIRGAEILLAEDNLINQQVATELLQGAGFKVTIANNGLQVLDHLEKSNDFDIILMDLQMPEMGGYEASSSVRMMDKFDDLPIVAMTADAMQGVKERCLEVGMNDFITKPIDPSELFSTLLKWIKEGNREVELKVSNEKDKLEIPKIQGVNVKDGLSRVAGNTRLYLKLLKDFAGKNKNVLEEAQAAHSAGDDEKGRRIIHTLKGTTGNLGITQAHVLTKELEHLLIEKGWEDFETVSKALSDELQKIIHELDAQLNTDAASNGKDTDWSQVFEQLEELLKEDDPSAMDVLEKAGQLDHIKYEELKDQISSFEFEEALDTLNEIKEELK